MDQRLVQVEDEKLIEAFLLKLKRDLRCLTDCCELGYLLDNIDRLNDLHRDVFVDGFFEALIRVALIFAEDIFWVQRCVHLRLCFLDRVFADRGRMLLSRAELAPVSEKLPSLLIRV